MVPRVLAPNGLTAPVSTARNGVTAFDFIPRRGEPATRHLPKRKIDVHADGFEIADAFVRPLVVK